MLVSCDHACFEGIELDTSTKTDVLDLFGTLGVDPVMDDYDGAAIWSWGPEDAQLFVTNVINPRQGFITFHGEVVRQVSFMLEAVDLTIVIEAFGAPDAVIEQRPAMEQVL
jgi:hypothetical protein